MRRIRAIAAAWIWAVWPACGAVPALAGGWVSADHVQLRLIAGRDGLGDGTLDAGLQVRLDPGWKFYWRVPGDAGVPPTFDWSASLNLADVAVRWPAPDRYDQGGLTTYVYADEVVLPVRLRAADPRSPLGLRLTLDYGVCKDICIPYRHELEIDVPAGAGRASAFADLIARYAARVPGAPESAGWRIGGVRVDIAGERPALVVAVEAREPFRSPVLIAEAAAPLVFGASQVALADGGRTARFRLPVASGGPGGLAGRPITLTLIDGASAAETAARVED